MGRRTGAALMVAAALILAGCAPTGIDPALTTAVADAISAGASAELGLELDEDDRILPGTLTTLLGDMAENLADTARDLELPQTDDAADAAYRAEALSIVRMSRMIGRTALRIVLEEAADPESIPRQTVFQPELAVRASTRSR